MRAVPILEVVQREFKGRFHLHCDIKALISLKIVFLVLLSVFLPSRPHCLAPLKERFTIFLTKREVKKKKTKQIQTPQQLLTVKLLSLGGTGGAGGEKI